MTKKGYGIVNEKKGESNEPMPCRKAKGEVEGKRKKSSNEWQGGMKHEKEKSMKVVVCTLKKKRFELAQCVPAPAPPAPAPPPAPPAPPAPVKGVPALVLPGKFGVNTTVASSPPPAVTLLCINVAKKVL